MNSRFFFRRDLLLALLLAAGFVSAGWKTLARAPSADFAAAPVQPAPAPPRVVSPSAQRSPDGSFGFDADFVSSVPGQAVHAASLVELRNGALRAVWFSGSREGAGDVAIKTAVMDPVSLKWGAETALLTRAPLERGLWRYVKKLGNPVIARAPDGSLNLWLVTVSLGGWAGSSISWARSDDEGASWSTPRRLVTSPFLNISTLVKGAPLAFADGQTGLPVYHEFVGKFAELLRLDAQGRVVDKVRITGSLRNLQPVVLVKGPTQADVFMRSGTAGAMLTSGTADAGKTWSPSHATPWPNPDSALAGVVARDGTPWLALNPAPRNRQILSLLQSGGQADFAGARQWVIESAAAAMPLTIAAHERLLGDELRRRGAGEAEVRAYVASARRQLCTGDNCAAEFSYPYLLQSRDGYLHLVYTWHRSRIKHVRLDPLQTPTAGLAAAPANVAVN